MTLLIALSTLIGILLGLLGGGGSILTVPVLVYIADLPAKSAIVTSLIVVCITSSIAVINHAKNKRVCWKTGTTFGLAGMMGAFIGGRISAYIPDPILLVLFAIVMVSSATAMLKKQPSRPESLSQLKTLCPRNLPVAAILFDGLLVGLVTGLVGVGGGFLLVPALTLLAGLPIQGAIGTSLFIIVLQSSAALAGHANHMHINIELTLIISCFAIIGSFAGSSLSGKIKAQSLKKGFGVFVLFLGCFLLYQELTPTLIAEIHKLIIQYQEFLSGALSIISLLLLYRLWSWVHTLKSSYE